MFNLLMLCLCYAIMHRKSSIDKHCCRLFITALINWFPQEFPFFYCWLPFCIWILAGIIKLKNNGDFFIANEGRRPIYIDGRPVLSGNKWKLNNNSVVEVGNAPLPSETPQPLFCCTLNHAFVSFRSQGCDSSSSSTSNSYHSSKRRRLRWLSSDPFSSGLELPRRSAEGGRRRD